MVKNPRNAQSSPENVGEGHLTKFWDSSRKINNQTFAFYNYRENIIIVFAVKTCCGLKRK